MHTRIIRKPTMQRRIDKGEEKISFEGNRKDCINVNEKSEGNTTTTTKSDNNQ